MQECAYVCNMAVNPEYRRRGYGLLLLEAAEEIARLGGQRDLYLHLRSVTMWQLLSLHLQSQLSSCDLWLPCCQ